MKRFIVFAYDSGECGGGFRDVYSHEDTEYTALVSVENAKAVGQYDTVELYDAQSESLSRSWFKSISGEWVEDKPEEA